MLLNYYEITVSLLLLIAFGVTSYLSLVVYFGYEHFVTYPRRLLVAGSVYCLSVGVAIHLLPVLPELHKEIIYGIQGAGFLLIGLCFITWREYFGREVVFISGLVWSDPEKDSEERRIDEIRSNLAERITWLVETYTMTSRCNFKSNDAIGAIKHYLLAGEHEQALAVLSELLDMLLLDKITDLNSEQLEVMNSFGSVMENCGMLKTRIEDSQMMEEFFAEKSLALRTLCFQGSFYCQQQVENIINSDSHPSRIEKLAGNMADLYLYKKQRAYNPVYYRSVQN